MLKNDSAISTYWKAYGRWNAVIRSKYFWVSILVTFLCSSFWINNPEWSTTPLSGLPSLLGFALGGYGVWLSVGNPKLKQLLSLSVEEGKEHSDFLVINATFVHFILLQIIAYIYLLILNANSLGHFISWWKNTYPANFPYCFNSFFIIFKYVANGLGFFIFIYSIMAMLAAAFAIFNIAIITDDINTLDEKDLDFFINEQINKKNNEHRD